eukprot:15440958-Alexandrium_andersonii.AAC.1
MSLRPSTANRNPNGCRGCFLCDGQNFRCRAIGAVKRLDGVGAMQAHARTLLRQLWGSSHHDEHDEQRALSLHGKGPHSRE